MVDSAGFSSRLQQLFDAHDLNASSFAQLVGVGRSSISHILSGRNKPSLDFVMSVVDQFEGVSFEWLLYGKEDYFTIKKPTEKQASDTTVIKESDTHKEEISDDTADESVDEILNDESSSDINTDKNNSFIGKKVSRVLLIYSDNTFEELSPR